MDNSVNVVTESNKEFLYKLVSSLAIRDNVAAQKGNKKRAKDGRLISRPYSLAPDTSEAHDYYKMALRDNLTIDEVGSIKAFINLQKVYGN